MPRDKKSRRKLIRLSLIGGNLVLLIVIGLFLINNRSTSQTIRASTVRNAVSTAGSVTNPLDQLSSAQIAYQAAQLTHLPELTAVRNQADSEVALLSVVPNDSTAVAKPQIVSTSQKSKYDIIRYKVRSGDSVDSIANKFHITVGSVTGSNSLAGTAVIPGTVLFIPPGNGIVYQVQKGDTVSSIVAKYGADRSLLVTVNDAENGLRPGDRIWIPNVLEPGLAPSYIFGAYGGGASLGFGYTPIYGYNGYDYGFCTWYVASQIAVPSNWGNANTWDDYARHTPGWTVSLSPRVGAIGQTDEGFAGHVGIIEAVSPDGSMIKYSDMNGLAGWGVVGHSGWVSASRFEHFIYHL